MLTGTFQFRVVGFIAVSTAVMCGLVCPLTAEFHSLQSVVLGAGVTFDVAGAQPASVSVSGIPQGFLLPNDVSLTVQLASPVGIEHAEVAVFTLDGTQLVTYTLGPLPSGTLRYDWQVIIERAYVVEPGVRFYVKAVDVDGRVSYYDQLTNSTVTSLSLAAMQVNGSLQRTVSPNGGTVVYPDANMQDGDVTMIFPLGALSAPTEIHVRLLASGAAEYGPAPNAGLPLATYSITDVTLARPVTLSLLYYDTRQPQGIVDGTEISETIVRMMRWDGFEWRLVGGSVDTNKNLVTAFVSRFGVYGLFAVQALSADTYRAKERIITPNGDGINDTAGFDGLAGGGVSVKIYDVTGKKIREVSSLPYEWDGRDDDGRRVENGVYIYQFTVDGTRVSGVIAVAK